MLFRVKPSVPAVNKWSKVGPLLDFAIPLVAIHRLLHKILLRLQVRVAADIEQLDDTELDPILKSEGDFSRLQGVRYKASLAFFGDRATPDILMHLGLCLEPMRMLTAWWMRRARTVDYGERMLDAIYAPYSPIASSLQYLASMLRGDSGRLVLVWRPHAESLHRFYEQRPDLVRSLRRLLLVTHASIFRRHSCAYSDASWAISKLADGRIPEEERLAVAADFDARRSCCIAAGAARSLKDAGISGAELFRERKWHTFLRLRCQLAVQSVCDLEWKHGQNRRR